MIDETQILDGPRWIKVEPDGALGEVGNFLGMIGLGDQGSQAAALLALVLLVVFVACGLKRVQGRTSVGPVPVPSYQNAVAGAGAAPMPLARDPSTALPKDRTMGLQDGRLTAKGAASPARPPRPGCAWQRGRAASGMTLWVCATCRATSCTGGAAPPGHCGRLPSAAAA